MVGADLATNPDQRAKLEPGISLVSLEMVARLESRIDELVAAHPCRTRSSSPARTPSPRSSTSRAVRYGRAERRVVELRESGAVVNEDAFHLNRLSDALFVLARVAAGETEPVPTRAEAPG